MQIILIEPDRILAATYVRSLKRAGHVVRHAVAAEQAIQMADSKRPDVVILSLELARHNGVEFLYEFRSYTEWQDVPVVALASLPMSELLGDGILRQQLGVEAVLVRSQTHAEDLVRAVERAAKGSKDTT